MIVTVKRDFPFSADGIATRTLAAGETVDIPDRFVPGLEEAGFVARPRPTRRLENRMASAGPETKPLRDAVVIPEGWRDFSWPALRSLASSLSDAPIRNKDDAIAAIAQAGG